MTRAATRNAKGHYSYRGYTIEDMKPYGGPAWALTCPGEDAAHDMAETLKDCKAIADRYEDMGAV